MKKILIIILAVVAIIAIALSAYFTNAYYNYKSLQGERTKYPSTYFFEPSSLFVACYTNDECIKVKGTACSPSKGGAETCINKEHMQEYLANIEITSGKEWEVNCPNINNSSNKECSCINNICSLVS
jgi:hypothetical protein